MLGEGVRKLNVNREVLEGEDVRGGDYITGGCYRGGL